MVKRESKKQRIEKMYAAMVSERASFISHWRELAENILPRRPRWTTTDYNKGDKRNQKVYDSTPTYAARTLRSGMMSGVTSAARPWFRISTQDPGMMESGDVRDWLYIVTERMQNIFRNSNLYQQLPIIYGDIGTFATASMFVEEDFEKVIHCTAFPIGSYCISANEKGRIDKFSREFPMTVRNLISKFCMKDKEGKIDFSNVSRQVKKMYEDGDTEHQVTVRHVIMPNWEYDPAIKNKQFKKFTSVYYEASTTNEFDAADREKFLVEGGYDLFPVLAPRWETNGEESYGTDCPGMVALPDIKQLHQGEKRRGQAIDKMVTPTLTGPSSLRRVAVSSLPGDIVYQDVREGQQGLRPVHEVNPRVLELSENQEVIRQRIRKAFFEDLFLMMANSDRREITAREVDERHEEKMWALGPVLEGLDLDLLAPLIDITFAFMLRQGLVPQPPDELSGAPLKVEYTSVMAAAQKLIGLGNVERLVGFTAQMAAANPDVLDKLDMDQVVDVYSDMTGAPPGLVRSDDEVAQLRQQRQQALQQQQQMAMVQQAAAATKDFSSAASNDAGDVLTQALGG